MEKIHILNKMGTLVKLAVVLFAQTFCYAVSERATKPVDTFMLVGGRLLSGNVVYYQANPRECTQMFSEGGTDFEGFFGGYVDFFELVDDKDVVDIPFVKFSDLRNERNQTNDMVSVHRELTYWSNETVDVTVSVATPDLNLVLSVNKYTCIEKKGVRFFTAQKDAMLITKYSSLEEALKNGERVRFVTEFRICQGAKMANNIGGEIKAYDYLEVDQTITKIVTTIQTMNTREEGGFVNHILYGEVYSNAIIYFTDTIARPLSRKGQDTDIQCYMQQDRPGGSVEFFLA